jgi:hypothetical protein
VAFVHSPEAWARIVVRVMEARPVAEGLVCVLRHQALELALCPFMLLMGLPGSDKDRGKFRPGIGGGHVDDADGLDARPRRTYCAAAVVRIFPLPLPRKSIMAA